MSQPDLVYTFTLLNKQIRRKKKYEEWKYITITTKNRNSLFFTQWVNMNEPLYVSDKTRVNIQEKVYLHTSYDKSNI